MDNFFTEHLMDLSERCLTKNIYTYSNFLNADEQNELLINKRNFTDFVLFGGAEGCERKMVRFGNEDDLYYSETFPIDCIKIEPLNIKFAEELTHRDYLGAIMNLSVEREHIGDIIIKKSAAFCFVTKKMSSFICENLTKIRHTNVKCSFSEFEGAEHLFTLEDKEIIVSSMRLDCIICAVYNLSRSTGEKLIEGKKVYINSALTENNSVQLKSGDTVSVRGYGKFITDEALSLTKKNRMRLRIKIYK